MKLQLHAVVIMAQIKHMRAHASERMSWQVGGGGRCREVGVRIKLCSGVRRRLHFPSHIHAHVSFCFQHDSCEYLALLFQRLAATRRDATRRVFARFY